MASHNLLEKVTSAVKEVIVSTVASTNATTSPGANIPCHFPSPDEGYVFQHVIFQLANLFLFISLLAPHGLWGIFYLRLCLFLGFLCFLIWGAIVMCLLDVLLWNLGNTILNLIQVGILINKLRPHPIRQDFRDLYIKVFKQASMNRLQFKTCYKLKSCKLVRVTRGHAYATPGKTRCDRISVLLKGSMEVYYGDKYLHLTTPFSFIDSPEYMAFTVDDLFQVSIRCREDCTYLTWDREELAGLFLSDAVIGSQFEHALGRDVAFKLFKNNERQLAHIRGSRTDLVKLSFLERTEIQDIPGPKVLREDNRHVPLAEVTEMIDEDGEEEESDMKEVDGEATRLLTGVDKPINNIASQQNHEETPI